ncbi:MAG: N-acetyltransferase [Puniceicoccaceae bacterium]|nr:MAG: N-acetyltransferase [Puniceicoccaceae bacterium]
MALPLCRGGDQTRLPAPTAAKRPPPSHRARHSHMRWHYPRPASALRHRMTFTTRTVLPRDYGFLWELRVTSMRDHIIEAFGTWDEDLVRSRFDETFDPPLMRILQLGGHDAGVIKVEDRPHERFLARIEILPAFQSRGLGTAVIRDLLARPPPKPVLLHVFTTSPARRFYERLGFTIISTTPFHHVMKAPPRASPGLPQ